jgi:glycine/D-amino acid oxidase-like deaminating enzyme
VGPRCRPRHPALADGRRQAVDQAEAAGKLQAFANTAAKSLVIENGRIKGVVTDRGTIMPTMSWSAPASGAA